MKLTPRSFSKVLPLLFFAIFWGVIYLRALPAWFRGSYTTEGGVWLSQMWQLGFVKSLSAIRPDYCVFGNLVVMQVAEWINALLHGANLDHAASIQHHAACIYTALMFTIIFCVLRRGHGVWTSAFVCLVMLLMPDLDGENRIFGEVTNLGYFSALVVLFVYYDLWLCRDCSKIRLAVYLCIIAFHIATSPLAGMIATAFWGAMVLREGIEWLRTKQDFKPRLVRLWPHLIVVSFALLTILRAQRNNPYARFAADTAQMKARFVEIVFCRQILYPLVLNFYTWFTDTRTLVCLAVFVVLLGAYAFAEWKRRTPLVVARVTGVWLIFGAALGMAAATAYSRQWLILRDQSYETVWPARYYIAQNMVMGALIALVLARLVALFPRMRAGVLVFTCVMFVDYGLLQRDKIALYLSQDEPAIVARHWPYQLRRVHAMQTLVGDQAVALKKLEFPVLHTVEIHIENHSMQVDAAKAERAAATRLEAPSDTCPMDMAVSGVFNADEGTYVRDLVTQNLRIIPRAAGVLVTFDVLLSDIGYLSSARRKLWLGAIPGKVDAKCFAYSIPVRPEDVNVKHAPRWNWLFKACLFIEGGRSIDELQRQLASLDIAVGAAADKFIAHGTLLPPLERLRLSSMLGDEKFALALHPLSELFRWNGNESELHRRNLQLKDGDLVVQRAGEEDFDEEAFLRYNPDIAGAVARKSVASGRAYMTEFGSREQRQICRYSVTLDVSARSFDAARVSGVRVSLQKGRKELPPFINCVLHGDAGQSTAIRLQPAEGGHEFSAYFLPQVMKSPAYPVKSIEIEFEGVTSERSFQLHEITLLQSAESHAP